MFNEKNVNVGFWISIIVISIFLLPIFGQSSSAQVFRAAIFIDGLLVASSNEPDVGEDVFFSIDLTLFISMRLHEREILAVEWEYGDGTIVRSRTLSPTFHAYQAAGNYVARVTIFTPIVLFTTTSRIDVRETFEPAGISDLESIISQYDFDQNNLIGDSEFFALLEAWVSSQVNDAVFFTGVDLWVQGAAITSLRSQMAAPASATLEAEARLNSQDALFTAAGDFEQLSVEVFDTSGNPIFNQRAAGSKLAWNLRDRYGQLLANGLYFYVIHAMTQDGELMQSLPTAMLIMR